VLTILGHPVYSTVTAQPTCFSVELVQPP